MTAPKPKKLKFDDDVLEVFRSGTAWGEDGLTASFTAQLKPTLYANCKKAITALGGKWVKAKNTHVFEKDPRPRIEGLLANGHLEVERDGFFETPPAVVDLMLECVTVKDGDKVLEPSAGKGAIVRHVLEAGYHVNFLCIEKNAERCKAMYNIENVNVIVADFMQYDAHLGEFDLVLMNPPFENGQDMEHVARALEFVKPGGELVSVMSPHFRFAEDARSQSFRKWLDVIFEHEIIHLPEGSFKASGTNVNAVLVYIRKPEANVKPKRAKAVKVHDVVPLPPGNYMARVPLELDPDVLVEMNKRAESYSAILLGDDVEKQVRHDFARYGAYDPSFVYNSRANMFTRIGATTQNAGGES